MNMPYQSRLIFLIFIRSLSRSSEDCLPMDQCSHRLNSISTLTPPGRLSCLFRLENSKLSDSFIIILLLQLTSTLTWILNCGVTIVTKMGMRIHVAHKKRLFVSDFLVWFSYFYLTVVAIGHHNSEPKGINEIAVMFMIQIWNQ